MPIALFIDAVTSGDTERVATFLAEEPSLANMHGEDGVSAILTALYHGKSSIARQIAATPGATIDIFAAAALGDTARLQAMLAVNPALVSAWSPDGFQVAHLAAFFGQPDTLDLLLALDAPPDLQVRHAFGVRPLHAAVACGDRIKAQRMARALLARGADVNARQGGNERGFTPLMAAAQNNDAVLARLLLDAGADATIQTAVGKTALDFAREEEAVEVAALLTA